MIVCSKQKKKDYKSFKNKYKNKIKFKILMIKMKFLRKGLSKIIFMLINKNRNFLIILIKIKIVLYHYKTVEDYQKISL